jgi:hypothetical protein
MTHAVYIKTPSTPKMLPNFRQLIADGRFYSGNLHRGGVGLFSAPVHVARAHAFARLGSRIATSGTVRERPSGQERMKKL